MAPAAVLLSRLGVYECGSKCVGKLMNERIECCDLEFWCRGGDGKSGMKAMNTDVKLLRNVVVGHPGRVGNHLLRTQKSGAVGSKDITFEVGAQIVGPLS